MLKKEFTLDYTEEIRILKAEKADILNRAMIKDIKDERLTKFLVWNDISLNGLLRDLRKLNLQNEKRTQSKRTFNCGS